MDIACALIILAAVAGVLLGGLIMWVWFWSRVARDIASDILRSEAQRK